MSQQEVPTIQQLIFASKKENISLVEQLIDSVCEEYKVNEDYYGNILISITEAVNNAIVHGNKDDVTKDVHVTFEYKDDAFIFKVKDQGSGFDYEDLPDPTDPENLEKPNGRGVFLMKNLADEVEFHEDGKMAELTFKIA